MRALSVVMSKNRPELLRDFTLSWLVLSQHPYRVYVEPQDEARYRTVVPAENLHVIDANGKGLGYVKAYVAKEVNLMPDTAIFKLDDDIRGWHRRGKMTKELSVKRFDQAIADGLEAFSKFSDVAAISYPYRWELYTLEKWTAVNRRLQTAYLIRSNWWKGDERVSTFEDFYNFIWLRVHNQLVLRYGEAAFDEIGVGQGPGGLQDFNRRLMAEKEATVLQELYPALRFKPVDKPWRIEPVLKGGILQSKTLITT